MGKIFATIIACGLFLVGTAQTVSELQETARSFQKSGDFDNAILVLKKATDQEPGNVDLKKDLAISYYLARQYPAAATVLRPLTERPDADEQVFQLAALVERGQLNAKEADRLYKAGLKKFPNSGMLYCEYGDLLEQKDAGQGKGIVMWEKGIETNPEYSGNYYFAAKFYDGTPNQLWSLFYGEIFVNLESYTGRTTEIKNLLFDGYKKLYAYGIAALKGKNGFENTTISTFQKQNSLASNGINPDVLTAIRARFILDWYNSAEAAKFPFKLLDLHQQLLRMGLFEAYNQWLFGPAANIVVYQNWTASHQPDYTAFNQFQRNRVFKIPTGQYYR